MFKVSIKKQNVITHEAKFQTMELAQEWLSVEEAKHSFGLPEHQVEVLNENGTPKNPRQFVTIPTEYTVTITDITVELQKEIDLQTKIAAGRKAKEACELVLAYIAGCNLDKELTIEQITQMQVTFANAAGALNAGRPTLAKMAISAIVPDGVIVTAEEKAQALNLLSDY